MNTKMKLLFTVLLIQTLSVQAQHRDTIRITLKNINTQVLREGTHRYLVYFKMKKDSVRVMTQFWTRTIKRTLYKNKPAIEILQEWEDKDSIMHIVKSYSDEATLQPLYHETWWKVQTSKNNPAKTVTKTVVDMMNNTVTVNDKLLTAADTGSRTQKIWAGYQTAAGKQFFNWHLDLETFPILPYRKNVTFLIPFYDPGTASGYEEVAYTVTGEAVLEGYDQQKINCWLLVNDSPGNKEIFWISKKTKEVLKLEQVIGSGMYRFKIKLGFSN